MEVPLSDLHVISVLGRGAKGVVFLVRSKASGETLALKAVSRSRIRDKGGRGEDAYRRISFEREVLGSLRHRLLPSLRGFVSCDGFLGFLMDFAAGGNLTELRWRQTEKMFSDEFIRFYAAELVLALEHLHAQGIVYRDLKPENILIQETGHIMLVDFDLSAKLPAKISALSPPSPTRTEKPDPVKKSRRLFPCFSSNSGVSPETPDSARNPSISSETSGKSNSFVGTEEYVAPEIIKGDGHDYAVDWWSLGIVLYEMLYGRTPFRGQNRKETFYRILNMEVDLVGEKTALRDLIGRLLEKEGEKRIGAEEIKRHEFFRGVNWEGVLTVERTPFIPLGVDWEEGESLDVERCVEEVLGGGEGKKGEGGDGVRKFPQNEDFSVF